MTTMTADVAILPLSRDRAEELTATIKRAATSFVNAYDRLRSAIEEAKTAEAHIALGFKSWQAYIADTFADVPFPKLARDERDTFVAMLSGEGMSVRAIAAVTGDSKSTVANVLRDVSKDGHQTAKTVIGLDGKEQTRATTERKPPKHKSVVNAGVSRAAAAVAAFADVIDLDDTMTPEAAQEYAEALAQVEAEVHRLAVLLRKRARKAGK